MPFDTDKIICAAPSTTFEGDESTITCARLEYKDEHDDYMVHEQADFDDIEIDGETNVRLVDPDEVPPNTLPPEEVERIDNDAWVVIEATGDISLDYGGIDAYQ